VLDLPPAGWRTRFAPAPTGHLHLGHAVNAIWVWGLARRFGGSVVLRIENHDLARSRAEYESALREDLDWLGFTADEEAPRQSERGERYEEAMRGLGDLVYPCSCSRKTIQAVAERLGRPEGEEVWYPGSCRERGVEPAKTPARRARLEREEIAFTDLRLGERRQTPAEQCGDLAIRDRDGHWSYQFAVVVDDLDQRIDVVVRGEDLLASTGRQVQLAALLGRDEPPRFLHHPLVLRPDGRKLSKSNRDTGIRELRAAGWSAARVLAEAARVGDWPEELGAAP
jgi:glutamyl-tRNA synthetase/glutamyl-Q tRNA(Asp) synthetase